jgi:arylsulfatase A-like enzyme
MGGIEVFDRSPKDGSIDELVRVPVVCAGPMFPANATIDKQVRHVDLLPTILEAAGTLPDSLSINGKSLFPFLSGEEHEDRLAYCEAVGSTLPNNRSWIAGLRTTTHKYCFRPFNEKPYEELYDLRADPLEKNNLASTQTQVCAELRATLQSLSQEFESQPILQGQKMTDAEQQVLEERLKDLGYIE